MNLQESIISKSSRGEGLAPISSIVIPPDRIREDTSAVQRYIDEDLAPSIVENGIIQPPVLHLESDGSFTLIAGWCRLTASKALGLTEIPYCTRQHMEEDERIAVELEENDCRLGMTWQERCLAIEKVHNKRRHKAQAEGDSWGVKQSGRLLGVSAAQVSNVLKVAEALRTGDTEISKASNISEAHKIFAARKEDDIISSLAASAGLPSPKKRKDSALPSSSGIDLSSVLSPSTTSSESESLVKKSMVTEDVVNLGEILFNMDNREWFDQQEDESIDLIYTDIPYGIDMDNLDFGADDLERVSGAHDVEENLDQMPVFLANAYRVLGEQGYCLFWYDLAHHEKLLNWAEEVGFTVQPYPLIWCKEHPVRNRAAGTWWTKSVEYVFVARKGTATLRRPQVRNWMLADGSAERKTQRNPFSKPFAVSKWILEAVTVPGMTMCDPYAGEGSLVRCAMQMGLKVKAIEKEKHHFDRLTEHVKQVISNMTRDRVTFEG